MRNSENVENFEISENLEENEKLKNLNKGFLTEINLEKISCICGKKLTNSKKSAFCVACGNPTCSEKCHYENFEKKKICTFSENFLKEQKIKSLRSLTFENVKIAEKLNLATGSFLQKTSKSFLYGMKHFKKNHIFLQRGFRHFGNPINSQQFLKIQKKLKNEKFQKIENSENLQKIENSKEIKKSENFENFENFEKSENLNFLKNLKILKEKKLDYFFNRRRLCYCNCLSCSSRNFHPIISCWQDCQNSNQIFLQDFLKNEKLQKICECNCEFCKSGQVNLAHKDIDCILFCDEKDSEVFLDNDTDDDN